MKGFKFFLNLATLLSTIMFTGCYEWNHNVRVDAIEYSQIRYQYENSGMPRTYSIGKLKHETVVAGIPYKGWLYMYDNGQVAGGMLTRQTVIKGLIVPKDTWVEFYRDGVLKKYAFPYNVMIQGYKCIGSGGKNGTAITFHRTGKIHSFYSPKDVIIHKIPCRGGIFNIICLDSTGFVSNCTAAYNCDYQGTQIRSGQKLTFKCGKLIRENIRCCK